MTELKDSSPTPFAAQHYGALPPLPSSETYTGPIWHFTDSAALVSIVLRKQLWATAATMLNDPQELIYGARRIVDWYDRYGEEVPGGVDVHAQLTHILKDDFNSYVEEHPAYIVCASEDYRLLNQWLNYGSTKGVAVRLTPHADLVPVDPPMMQGFLFKPQWVKVEYEPRLQDERIRRVLASISSGPIGQTLGTPGAANPLIRGMLASLAASMKDDAYAEEREVRLISYLPQGAKPQHRGAARGVIPYVEITHYSHFGWALMGLQELGNPAAPLPIEEVRVGPPDGESERQRIVGVTSLLRSNGSSARVNGSDIRYLPA
ncbi:hypothetical protein [Microbacterium enclense]|uniref:hypothetical protein n=1 Tax=Microbacterium enclense TaxID=993073 RepID=UPI003F7E1C38